MNIARFSVRRPVFTTMSMLIVIILGMVSLSRLPVDLMPDITYPTLSVATSYENASPEEVEELITRPIEEAMSAIPGVEEVSSISSEGSSNVRVTFVWGTDLGEASNDIRDRLDRVKRRLPDDADAPALRKFDIASFPILFLGASSRLDPVQMRRIIDEQVKYRIERVDGVAALDVWGGLEREIHVNVDPDKMKALGLALEQLISRIRAANITLPAGVIESGNYELTLRTPGEYTDLDQLRNTAIATRAGLPVRLRDVANVEDRWQRITRVVRVNGMPGIRLAVNKRSGTNTVDVAQSVLQEIESINEDIPQIHLTPIVDTSEYIQRSITNVGSAALYGSFFAIIVLLIFLRNIRSTAIISVAIPVSVIATFALIYFGGFTLNIMTLGGLALGIGMLVDNAIVVLENIYRMREDGHDAESAAIKGAQEVTAAIIASTLTTLAVFLPLVFVRGMAGIMFKQLAYVISFSLLCSLVVALTVIPMLASKFLHPESLEAGKKETFRQRIFRITGMFFNGLENEYKGMLHWALDHRLLVIVLGVLLFGGSFFLVPLVGTELMPQGDEGEVRVEVEMEVGTRLELIDKTVFPMEEIVRREVPELKNMLTSAGGSHWRGGGNTGHLRISLNPQAERERSSEDVAADLRKAFAEIPGAIVRVRAGQGLFLLRRIAGGDERVEVEIRGFDLETADALAERVKEMVETVEGVTDARISRDMGTPERLIQIDRAKAETMKVNVRQIADMLQTVVSGTRAGNYREGGDEYAIRVMVEDAEQQSLREILDLTITNADGVPVVLRNIVTVGQRSGPVRIERNNQERVVTVRANIQDRDLGSIIDDIRVGLRDIPVPQGFNIGLSGDYEEQQEAFSELSLGFILALILVYMVMASLYESLRDPFVVMFSVPLAAIGVIIMLFMTDTTFNMQSYIGCIMLGGIVVNNAILLVDYANLLRHEGMSMREAIEEAGRRRLRPILMTALTTICGLIPLALGLGEGGEAQAPLARAVIGGLISSTLITLVFVPVVYSIFEYRRSKKQESAGFADGIKTGSALLVLTGLSFCTLFSGCTSTLSSTDLPVIAPVADEPINEVDVPYETVEDDKVVNAKDVREGPLEATLLQSVFMALDNNRALQIERLEPLIFQSFEELERARFDPTISADVVTSHDRVETTAGRTAYGHETGAGAGASVFLPTGTSVQGEATTLRRSGSGFGDQNASRVGLTVTQALLRGFGLGPNLADLRQARLDTRFSEYELRGFAEALVAEVENTYWDYVLALRQVDIFQESLELAEQQLQETEVRIRVGDVAETERAAAQAEVALRHEGLINARSRVEVLQVKLLRLIAPGALVSEERRIIPNSKPIVPVDGVDNLEDHVDLGLRMRPEINQAQLLIQRGNLEIVQTRNGLLPRMDLFVTLGRTGYADSFGRSWGDIGDEGYDVAAGLLLDYPINNRAARARHNAAVLSQRQFEESRQNIEDLVREDVETAFIEVRRARQQVDATAATLSFQKEKLRAETAKFNADKSTALLVAAAQRDLLESQVAEVEAVITYLKALTNFYFFDGSLLMRRGIRAPGTIPAGIEP